MIQRREFSLSQNENSPRVNSPTHFRWCNFVAILLLLAFIFIMILSNVDFSEMAHNEINAEYDSRRTETKGSQDRIFRRRFPKSAQDFRCQQDDNKCTILCNGINTYNIYKELEPLEAQCGNATELFLYKCIFPSGAMKATFLQGWFHLKTLAIIDCNLNSIEFNAFQHESVKTLKSLYLINTNFASLSEITFDSLMALEVLNITNQHEIKYFQTNKFLRPLANNLQTLKMMQRSPKDYVYLPVFWLEGLDMIHLEELDLSRNNFHEQLHGKTFANCRKVKILKLAQCNLVFLQTDVFDPMIRNLEYLDLTMNHLKTVDMDLLTKWRTIGSLHLGDNDWDCTCNKMEFVKTMEVLSRNKSVMGTFKCFSPLVMKDMEFKQANEKCKDTHQLYGSISCRDLNSDVAITIDLLQALMNFSISSQSLTSVKLIFTNNNENIHLIYFTNYTNAAQWITSSQQSIDYTLLIQKLHMATAYVFCLIDKGKLSISPFDCKSFWLPSPKDEVWIQEKEQAWVIPLVLLAICLFLFFGSLLMFIFVTLRNRRKSLPTVIRNQGPADDDSHQGSRLSYIQDQSLNVHHSDLQEHCISNEQQVANPAGRVYYEELGG